MTAASPARSWFRIVPLTVLVGTIGVGLVMAIDLWTVSVARGESRRALRAAAAEALRRDPGVPLDHRVAAALRGRGFDVRPGEVTLVARGPAARLRWGFRIPRELPVLGGGPQVVELLLDSGANPQASP